jgi:predicted ribosomally synthesized peptide with SipW-like signal peptide
MKKIILAIIALVILGGAFAYWYATAQANIGTLTVYEGSLDITREGKVLSGGSGIGVRVGDTLTVADSSRVALVLKDGSIIRLEAGSTVEVAQLEYAGKTIKQAVFKLTVGKLWAKPKPISAIGNFEVQTPSVVAAVRGTSFNTEYLQKASAIYVYRHRVAVGLLSNPSRTKSVEANQFFKLQDATLEADWAAGPNSAYPEQIDDWIRFNQKLDDEIDGPSEAVIPEEATTTDDSLSTTTIESLASTSTSTIITPRPTSTPPKDTNKPPVNLPTSNPTPTPVPTPTQTPQPKIKQPTKAVLSATNTSPDVGQSVLLKVQVTYDDGSAEAVTQGVTWTQTPELGTIKNPGYFTGIKEGISRITARVGSINSNTLSIQVGQVKQLSRIQVSCQKVDSQYSSRFAQAQCTAIAYYNDNTSTNVTNQSAWSVTGSAKGSITNTGAYTAAGTGTDTVSARFENLSGNTTIQSP